MKKYALVISLLLLIPIAFAIPPLILDVNEITNEIPYNGIAHFQIEITNNQDITEIVYIPTPRNEWDITVPEYRLNLRPGESKTIEIFISPPENIKLGRYAIYFEFKTLNNTEASTYEYLNLDITSEKPPIVEKIRYIESVAIVERSEESFLKTEYTITIENQGNIDSTGKYSKLFSNLDAFFVQSIPEQDVIEEMPNGKQFIWDYSVEAEGKDMIIITVSYLPLLIAIILIVIAVLLLGVYYKSSFSLTKEILLKRSESEHEKRIKIRLNIKNNTAQRQTNVIIQDYIPTPLILTKDDFGTIEPTTIKKKKTKILLTWKFDVLEPREERVISYGMKSRLKVIGKVFLPQAILAQKISPKKQITVRSKIIKLEI